MQGAIPGGAGPYYLPIIMRNFVGASATLTWVSQSADRVRLADGAAGLVADGLADGSWTLVVNPGTSGAKTITQLALTSSQGPGVVWDTVPGNGYSVIGVYNGATLLNASNGSLNRTISSQTTVTLYTSDTNPFTLFPPDRYDYTITVYFSDGTLATALARIPVAPQPPIIVPVPGENSAVADVAVDPRSHFVYVSSPRDVVLHTITSPNGGNNYERSFDIPVTHGATGLAVDSIINPSRVFVAHAFAPDNWKEGLRYINVDVFDLRSYLVGPQFGYVGAAPVKVAVNSQLHRAYVSNYYDKLAVIDTTTNTRLGWVKQKNYQGGWGIFASPLINWVHLATRDTGELVVFDGGNGDRLLQDGYIPTHFKPPSPCALYLTVAHEDTDHVFVTCPARKSVFFLVEPEMSILAAGELGTLELRQDGWVRVVQPQEVTWRELTFTDSHVSTNVGVWGIAVDRPAKRVYITDPIGDMLIVIQDDNNTGNVRVANYVRGPFDEPQGVAVDPAWQRIYVANAGNNTVTVLNALTPTQVITTVNLALP